MSDKRIYEPYRRNIGMCVCVRERECVCKWKRVKCERDDGEKEQQESTTPMLQASSLSLSLPTTLLRASQERTLTSKSYQARAEADTPDFRGKKK